MDAVLGLLGFIGIIVGLILIVKNKFLSKKPLKSALTVLIISFLMFTVGLALPSSSEDPIDSDLAAIGHEVEETEIDEPESQEPESHDPADISDKEDEQDETPEKQDTPPPSTTAPSGQLIVHFIDVGQGDAILIQTPSQNIVIDGGGRGTTVVNYLKSKGVTSLDLIIGTHPHADHIGGLIDVMQAIPVKEIIDPGVVHTTKTFEDYLNIIDQKDIIFTEGRSGMSRDLGGGARMDILHPSLPSPSHLNDASVVVKVTFGSISFMLTGDAESSGEGKILVQSRVQPTSTILKVGHHGSKTSTSSTFLKAVNPDAAIIMVGKNSYGHPHDETLAKLAEAGVKIYRTDVHGTIVITTNGQTYDINVKKPYQYTPPKKPAETVAPAPEPKPDPTPAPTPSGTYVGSKKSDKYHYPSCRHAKNILPENEIWFKTVQDAKAAGYVPCGTCKPPN